MAPRGSKRSASKAAGGVAKHCRAIAGAIKKADDVPAPVRGILRDSLVRTFGTYKEERHAFQKQVSDQVGKVLKEQQKKLQGAIAEANQKKAALESEAAGLSRVNDGAVGASTAAAEGLAAARGAVADSKQALKDAKQQLHDLEAAVKAGEAEAKALNEKKANLESLATDFVGPIREGTKHGVSAGKHVARVMQHHVDEEFLSCVERTFSKAHSAWGTFDNIVDKKFATLYDAAVAGVANEIGQNEAAKATRATQIENQKGAITSAEELVNANEQKRGQAATAAEEAAAAATKATKELQAKQGEVSKAAAVCSEAEHALDAFNKGALASYTEVESRTAPPPEPEAPAPLEEAMQPASTAQSQYAASPAVQLLSRAAQAVGLAPSPRVATSPRVAASPRQS